MPAARRKSPLHEEITHAPAIRRALLAWYRRAARDLPWRRTAKPYRVWLSEIMLQQTRVETVIPYFERFVSAFPSVADLAVADEQHVLRLWAGLGYYSRARNLHATARRVAREFGGRFPQASHELQQLPGIGRYTAAAIASICHDEPVAVLDGNVKRVIARLLAIKSPIDDPNTTDALWNLAQALLDAQRPGDFNQAMMELGAVICVPRQPRCVDCPLRKHCQAHALGIADALPNVKKKSASPIVHRLAVAVRNARGEVLLIHRTQRGLLQGMWTLPGAEIAPAEHHRPSSDGISPSRGEPVLPLAGAVVEIGELLGTVEHVFTHRKWRVAVHEGRVSRGRIRLREHDLRWFGAESLSAVPLATVDKKILAIAMGEPSGDR